MPISKNLSPPLASKTTTPRILDDGKACVKVKKVEEPEFKVLKYWPTPEEQIGGYTDRGVAAIIAHEERRLMVYKRADQAYIKDVVDYVSGLSAEGTSIAQAKEILVNYINQYNSSAQDDFLKYVQDEQIAIAREQLGYRIPYEYVIVNGNRMVDGLKYPHTVNSPVPTMKPAPIEGIKLCN